MDLFEVLDVVGIHLKASCIPSAAVIVITHAKPSGGCVISFVFTKPTNMFTTGLAEDNTRSTHAKNC